MFFDFPQPVLARDEVGTIITVLFVLFSIISWVVKAFGSGAGADSSTRPEAGKPPAEPRKRRRPLDGTLADEIRQFQEEVRQGGGTAPAGASRPARPVAAEGQLSPREGKGVPGGGRGGRSVEGKPVVKTPLPGGRGTLTTLGDKRPAKPVPPRSSEGNPVQRRPLADEKRRLETLQPHEMGTSVSQHTQEFMRERLANQVSADLESSVSASVSEHLGSRMAAPEVSVSASSPHPLVQALRQPASLRQALVLSLVLAPPPSRQRNWGGRPPDAGSA